MIIRIEIKTGVVQDWQNENKYRGQVVVIFDNPGGGGSTSGHHTDASFTDAKEAHEAAVKWANELAETVQIIRSDNE